MRTHTLILLTLILSGCGGDSSTDTQPGLPVSEGGSCELNSGELTCNGALSNLSNLDQLEGLTSINFDGAALSQQELDSIPVLDQVTSFTLNSRGSSIETFNAEQFPALNTLNLSNNSVLKRIDNLDLLPQLKVLNLQHNRLLETMDVSALDQLTHFSALYSPYLFVDLATLPAQNTLTTLEIAGSDIYIRPLTNLRSASTDTTPTELISQFTHLTHLTIDTYNGMNASTIESIIATIGHQLIKLSIAGGWGEQISLDASNLLILQHLDISYSNLQVDLTQLPDSIVHLNISYSDSDLAPLTNPSKLTNIISLGIGGGLASNEQVKALIEKYGEQLVELDVSSNRLTEFDPTPLTQLKALDVSGNEDLNFNLSLLPTDIEHLILSYTAIKDSSPLFNMTLLSKFGTSPASSWQHIDGIINANRNTLTWLDIANTDLPHLSLADMPKLSVLRLHGNSALSSLTLATLPSLDDLTINDNPAISKLSLTNLPALDSLYISRQHTMNELVIANTPLLGNFHLSDNRLIENVSLSNLSFLTKVSLNSNSNLKSLNFFNLTRLEYLDVDNNDALTSLAINNVPTLYSLHVEDNDELNWLAIDNLPALYRLNVRENDALTSLAINNVPALYYLNVEENDGLSWLAINNLPALYQLNVRDNNVLTSLAINNVPALFWLNVSDNDVLNSLALNDLPALYKLDVYNNNALTSLAIINVDALMSVDANSNIALTSLSILEAPKLMYLNVESDRELTTLQLDDLTEATVHISDTPLVDKIGELNSTYLEANFYY